eukprot:CRZ05348.1 hypothetical protein [Spongospora subterranea]
MVYRDSQMIWAARTKHVPISIAVSNFGAVPGMIVILFQNGELQISYLGTDPAPTSKTVQEGKEVDFANVAMEYRNLQKAIKNSMNSGTESVSDGFNVTVHVPGHVDGLKAASLGVAMTGNDVFLDAHATPICITAVVRIAYQQLDPIDNVIINVESVPGFITESNSFCIPDFAPRGNVTVSFPIRIFASKTVLPAVKTMKVDVLYTKEDGQPRVISSLIVLPFEMVAGLIPPIKNSKHFVTIDTNRPAPATLKELFSSMSENDVPNIFSVRYYGRGIDSTIILSKNAGRFRIQSSEFVGLHLLTSELIDKLYRYWNAPGEVQTQAMSESGPLQLSLDGALPFDDIGCIIEVHLKARQEIATRGKEMERLARQLRVIQKRLLARYKDATPSPLCNLDVLLRETLQALIANADVVRTRQIDVAQSGNELSSAMAFLCNLLTMTYGMNEENTSCLRSYFTHIIDDGVDQGWEERLEAAISYLLTSADRKTSMSMATELVLPSSDAKTLRKHMKSVCDRVAKGSLELHNQPAVKKVKSKSIRLAAQ